MARIFFWICWRNICISMHSKCVHQIRSNFDEEPEWHALNAGSHELNGKRMRVRIKPLFEESERTNEKKSMRWINGKSTFLKWHLMFKPSIKFVHFSHFQRENWPLYARYFYIIVHWVGVPRTRDPHKPLFCILYVQKKNKKNLWRKAWQLKRNRNTRRSNEIIAYIK